MDSAIPDVMVTGYEPLIENLELPDADDRHVLAAAIRCDAQAIITFNLKDFPASAIEPHGIEALHPDAFIEHQFDLDQGAIVAAAKQHRAALKAPPKSAGDYIETLSAQGLAITAGRLWDFIDLI